MKEEHPSVAGDGSNSASANEKVNQEDGLALSLPSHIYTFFAFESVLTLDNDPGSFQKTVNSSLAILGAVIAF